MARSKSTPETKSIVNKPVRKKASSDRNFNRNFMCSYSGASQKSVFRGFFATNGDAYSTDLKELSEHKVQLHEKDVYQRFRLHSESKNVDYYNQLNFKGLQRQALRSALVRGDCFALLRYDERPHSPYRLMVQLLEAEVMATVINAILTVSIERNPPESQLDKLYGEESYDDGNVINKPWQGKGYELGPGTMLENAPYLMSRMGIK